MTVPSELTAEAFFDLSDWPFPELFASGEPVWTALSRLGEVIAAHVAGAPRPAVPPLVVVDGDVLIGEGVVFEPGVYIKGPAIIGDRATLRQGAYIRENVIIGADCTVGHCSELKQAVLLPGSAAPHFNYLGDSLVGRRVNLGAGTALSNVTMAKGEIAVRIAGQRLATGRRKFGAILGDDCQTGCHAVLNPGTVAGRGCRFYPQVSAVGYFPPGSMVRSAVQRAER